MGAGRTLTAFGKHGKFSYQGNLDVGTKILFGRGKSFVVPPDLYAELLAHYRGRLVEIGASRNPVRDSLGSWLRKRLPDVELPSAYVGPILVEEGAAQRAESALRFNS